MALLIDGVNEVANPVMTFIPLVLMLLSGYGLGKIISIVRELRNNGNSGNNSSDRRRGNNNKSSNVIATIRSRVISDISNSSFSVKDLMSGSIVLNFLFISGFILFGLIIYAAKEYFSAFTIILVLLSTVGIYYLVLIPLIKVVIKRRKKSVTVVDSSEDSSSSSSSDNTTTARAALPSSRADAISTIRTYNDADKLLLSPSSFNAVSNIINPKNSNLLLILFGIALLSTLFVYYGIIIYYHPIFSEYDSIYLFLTISKSILLGNGLNHDYYLGSDVYVRYPPFVPAIDAWLIYSFGYPSLRLFPIYFVIIGSIAVYLFARNITKDSFLGLIASAAFLITPALLIVSSRFSQQLDISFVFALSATFYFLSEIIRNNNNSRKSAKIYFIMLIVCLSLLPLIREIGLIISLGILFLVLAIKFTHGNIMLRALFSVLSFLPFYVLSFFALFQNGFTNTNTISLITLITANIAIFFILTKVNKNQDGFTSLFRLRTINYLIPFLVPLIFLSSNMVMFNGPYPAYAFFFSNEYIESNGPYTAIFTSRSQGDLNLSQILEMHLLRPDLLFSLAAMGSIFIFFKLRGFGRLVYFGLKNSLKNNHQYLLILILLIFLLVIWSYLLGSGFEETNQTRGGIRHTIYFLPLLAVILVIGMNATKKIQSSALPSSLFSQRQLYYKLFYYGVIVLATYYFLYFSLYTWSYNNHFGGFWIEPFKSSFVTLPDLCIAASLFGALIIFELRERKISLWFKKYSLQRYLAFGFIALLAVQIYVLSLSLSSSRIILMDPIETIEQVPPAGWEESVFDVINCLSTPESGNILSFRAPAIPFFTNRTNYDLFWFGTFHSVILPLLEQAKDLTSLKQELLENRINYIVLPNEKNTFYNLVENVMEQHDFIQLINNTSEFEKRSFEKFDLYKYASARPSSVLNLIDEKNIWKPASSAKVRHGESSLLIYVDVDNNTHTGKLYNRAVLQTQISTVLHPAVLDLDYASQSLSGNATFYAEILDNDGKIIWGRNLTNTGGKLAGETFSLPSNIIDKPIEIRLYVITDAPGEHLLEVTKADVASC